MFATGFTFDGISCDEYELVICSFDNDNDGTKTLGSKIDFTTFKAPNSNKWVKIDGSYSEQLTLPPFGICKNPCTNTDGIFTEREIAFIERWLNRKDYKWLSFNQEGYEDIYFNAKIDLEKYEIDGMCHGFELTITCDSPFGYTGEQTLTINGGTSIEFIDTSDEIGVVTPDITIYMNSTASSSGSTVTISSTLPENNSTSLVINNCLPNEVITLNSALYAKSNMCTFVPNGLGYSGNHKTFYDDFNFQWITIGNTFSDRTNTISVTGDCTVEIKWRGIRKAVV